MTFVAVVDAWARETEARLTAVLRESAQDVAENVSVGGSHSPGTPVDTGFARSSWVAVLGETVPVATRRPKGLETGQLAADAESAASDMNVVCASADVRDVITLANTTEYLPYLEDGSTQPKAPFTSGWIAQTVAAWPIIVAQANARVRSGGRVA